MKVFFRVKTSEVEEIATEKWYNRWLDLLARMLLPGPDFHCVGFWYFGDFCHIFLPNIGKDQINVLPSGHRAPGIVPYGKSGAGYCIMFTKKMLDEGLTLQLLGQKLLISPGLYM